MNHQIVSVQEVEYRITSPTSTAPPSNGSAASSTKKHDLWRGFDAYTPELQAAKRRLADWYNERLDRGRALVLAGNPGSGKTHLALVVLAAYGAPHQSLMISEADLVANVRATYDGDGTEKMIMAQYRRMPLLILDDVGVAHVRPESLTWLQDIYWRILDRRAEMRLGTLITTNLKPDQFSARIGARAWSRLMGMLEEEADFVNLFDVPDYRMKGATR